ncbi:putative dehydrogenase [Microbacterium sp. ZKA21]|jgi:predicted dehydrogenase|uniref:Gfo/Idh/MocA family protein n=1 Tax=Microbacterium sp. ZKA21 TaxID=3381694 RepID=UPI003D1FF46A
MSHPLRYALVGAGSRAQVYLDAILRRSDDALLVAWADTNVGRLDWNQDRWIAADAAVPARFDLAELSAAVGRFGLDRVIITSPDFTHAELVVAALAGGADVIVEKPLTIDEAGVRRIAEAVRRTGRSVTVAFNYRYSPRNAALREVIARGDIGEVTSVSFDWMLDTSHGADYFRRWHRDKENSGGLLVHKSSHHFDLVSWWLDDVPERVYASGGLRFYGAENAHRHPESARVGRGSTDAARADPFGLDLRAHDVLRGLYFEQEQYDGYLRDRNVFDEGITIEDNLAVIADFSRGATLNYSLNAHAPWEGYAVAVNGTLGRAELNVVERGAVLLDGDGGIRVVDPSAAHDAVMSGTGRPAGERLVVQKHFGPAEEIPIPSAAGGHGGADEAIMNDLLAGAHADPLGRVAGWEDGVRALSLGIAANRSLSVGGPIRVSELSFGPEELEFRPENRLA